MEDPLFLRYAYSDTSNATLFNSAGLPASSFSDTIKISSVTKTSDKFYKWLDYEKVQNQLYCFIIFSEMDESGSLKPGDKASPFSLIKL